MKKSFSFFLIATILVLLKIYISFQETSTSLGNEQAKIAGAAATPALSLSSSIEQKPLSPFASRQPASIDHWKSPSAAFAYLKAIEQCFDKTCAYPNSDPREYGLAVAKHLSRELTSLYLSLENESTAIFDQYLPLILHYAQVEDGYVQEAALNMLARTTPSEESFNILNRLFADCRNPHIAKQVMGEWLKYRDQFESWQQIKKTLFTQLLYGSVTIKGTVIDQLQAFVGSDDRESIKQLQQRFPVGTPIYLSLGSLLERLHD